MVLNGSDFVVFERYKNAPGHAFSSGIVTEEDKDAYDRISKSLKNAIGDALNKGSLSDLCRTRATRFFRNGGVQGQRPKDLWASIVNREPNSFGDFPQIYVISSDIGLEYGFSVSINEDDYYNSSIKARNREIVPALYRKLPDPSSAEIVSLSDQLVADGGWHFGLKNRQGNSGTFSTLADLIRYLKTQGSERGGGSIYRIVPRSQIGRQFDIESELARAVSRFSGLMRLLVPSAAESVYLENSEAVRKFSEELPNEPEAPLESGKRWLLRRVAARQGQAKFRDLLIEAYGGRCAITGTRILATLQAAHIEPYDGPATNKASNGILLRADIHNLFDLGLILVKPGDMTIFLSPNLRNTSFGKLHGRKLRIPSEIRCRPRADAIKSRWDLYCGSLLIKSSV